MKFLKKIIPLLVLPVLMAHSVWMEVSNTGRVNQEATVHLYFGEIRSNLIEKGLEWYEGNIFKDFKAFVKPHNRSAKKALKLVPSKEAVTAVFTPDVPGIYQLTAFNEIAEVKDYRKHGLGLLKDSTYLRTTFQATSWRAKQQGTIDLQPMMTYDIVPFPAKNGYGDYTSHQSTWRVKEPVYAVFYIDRKPAADKEIRVYSPDGWTAVCVTDANGMFNFKPYTSGTYQAIYETKRALKGTYKGKQYNTTRVKVITNLNVK